MPKALITYFIFVLGLALVGLSLYTFVGPVSWAWVVTSFGVPLATIGLGIEAFWEPRLFWEDYGLHFQFTRQPKCLPFRHNWGGWTGRKWSNGYDRTCHRCGKKSSYSPIY